MSASAPEGDWLPGAEFVLSIADGFDQHLDRLSDKRTILTEGNGLLDFHERVAALVGIRSRHWIGQRRGFCAFLRRVREDADVIERHLFDEG